MPPVGADIYGGSSGDAFHHERIFSCAQAYHIEYLLRVKRAAWEDVGRRSQGVELEEAKDFAFLSHSSSDSEFEHGRLVD